jgi:DNA-binding IclR family transcriptional regulator
MLDTPKTKRSTAVNSGIQVFERADQLLGLLAGQASPVGLKSLANESNLNISTVHRILGALSTIGLVEHQAGGFYRLGLRWMEYGNLVRERLQIRDVARPFIEQLHEKIGEPVNLAIRDGDEIIYLDRAAANAARVRVFYRVGSRAPLHLTSLGKLFLAEETAEQIADYAKRTGLPGNTEHSLTRLSTLNQALKSVHQNGVAFDNEEAELGLRCVAAPVRDDQGALVAAVSVSSPSDRFSEHEGVWVPALKACADEVSRALGARL